MANRRLPAVSLSAICIFAVAIGASTAVFSVADKVLIRPLPLEEPHRLVVIVAMVAGGFLDRLLFEVPAIDGVTLAGIAALFSVVSVVAVYLPPGARPASPPR